MSLVKHSNIFPSLDFKGQILAEYIWLDRTAIDLRSKTRVLPGKVNDVSELPLWNYDGSSTEQAPTENSEIIIKPQRIYRDPFRGGDNILVLCDAYAWTDNTHKDLKPADTNFRYYAAKIHEKVKDQDLWFAFEQEYILFSGTLERLKWPLGWPQGGYPEA